MDVPAGIAGAISAAGVDGLADNHGIEQGDLVDVHWTDPADGTHKCRRGITVDVAAANAIEFDNDPAAEGDALPAEDTAVVVSQRVTINASFDGDDMVILGLKADQRLMVDFRTAAESLDARKLIANEGYSWATGLADNPLTGEAVATIVASNGSTVATVLYLGLLYDSVA